jgi:TolB-like protein/Flp pilus assembly protein TadD
MSDKPDPKRSLFAELKRRNVYKVGAMYCVAGWLLVQIVTQVFPIFHVSELAQRIIVLAIVAGFPLALVLSWIYELTPQGIVKTDEVAPGASIATQTGQKLNRAIIGVLLLAVVMMGARLLWPQATAPAASVAATAAASSDKSIAVLPFDNLSDDKSNAYFAEGIQDEVLTRLAKIGTLKVVSRTSTLQFAAHPGNLAEIAAKLGVANVVEGSVQKAGDAVRINVQLIRAEGDSHLWAETYDRKLDNVFGVQSEVAGAIAAALGTTLSGGERKEVEAVPTRNAAAYDAYLRGVALYRKGFHIEWYVESTDAFRQAVQADPEFAQAWAYLSRGLSTLIFWGVQDSPQARAEALDALERAERLQPDAFDTQMARAYYIYRVQRDYDEAQRRFEALHQRWPNESEVLSSLSYILARKDRLDEANRRLREALALDPLNIQYYKLLGVDLLAQRRFDEARQMLDRVREIAPGDQESVQFSAAIDMAQGRLDHAASLIAGTSPPQHLSDNRDGLIILARLQRRYADAIALLRKLLDGAGADTPAYDLLGGYTDLADAQRLAGDAQGAAQSYRKAQAIARQMHDQAPDNPQPLGALAWTQAWLGDLPGALASYQRLDQLVPETKDANLSRSYQDSQARVLAGHGRPQEALRLIEHLLQVNVVGLTLTPELLRLDPDWDALRGDARFQQLAGTAARP